MNTSPDDVSEEKTQSKAPTSLVDYLGWVAKQRDLLVKLNGNMSPTNQLSLYFRGIRNSKYLLLPAIYRDGLIENEDIIINECLARSPQDFVGDQTAFDKLVKMQHYGIPTRLLDITSNPLVALYFACAGDQKVAGRVFAIFVSKEAIKYSDSNTVSAVANLAVRPYREVRIVKAAKKQREEYLAACYKARTKTGINEANKKEDLYIEAFNKCPPVRKLLSSIQREKLNFLPLIRKEHLESVWAVKPKLNNNRIVRQDGAFLLFGISGTKATPLSIVDLQWAEQCILDMKRLDDIASSREGCRESDVPFLNEAGAKYGIGSEIVERYNQRDTTAVKSLRIGDDIRRYLLSELLRKVDAEEDNLRKQIIIMKIVERTRAMKISSKATTGKRKSADELMSDYVDISLPLSKAKFCAQVLQNGPLVFFNCMDIGEKKEMGNEIKAFGMTEDKLFPELDFLAKSLKNEYSCKDKPNLRF